MITGLVYFVVKWNMRNLNMWTVECETLHRILLAIKSPNVDGFSPFPHHCFTGHYSSVLEDCSSNWWYKLFLRHFIKCILFTLWLTTSCKLFRLHYPCMTICVKAQKEMELHKISIVGMMDCPILVSAVLLNSNNEDQSTQRVAITEILLPW